MGETRDDALLHITAQFVAAQEAGQFPRLDEYIQRYPRYAEEIADFVTYYAALEIDLPEPASGIAPLSASTRAALERARDRVEHLSADSSYMLTLQALADRQQLSFPRLAEVLNLSVDLLTRLAGCQFDPQTLPRVLLGHMARTLGQPIAVIQRVLGISGVQGKPRVAESQAVYRLSSRPSFRQALLEDAQLSADQKEDWQTLLECEGL